MINIRRLDGPFGVEVTGLNLSKPLPREDVRTLLMAFYENAAVVIPDQSMTPEEFERYGAYFGKAYSQPDGERALEGRPNITVLTNEPSIRTERQYNNANYWHTDGAHEEEIATATTLYCREAMAQGGSTLVADMRLAYDDLSQAMKRQLEGLVFVHHIPQAYDDVQKVGASPAQLERLEMMRIKLARHPAVSVHPVTGRKALYAVCGSARSIDGMPQDEARSLLEELGAHATKADYRTELAYSVGVVAAWDTQATLHMAPPLPPGVDRTTRRTMHRISVTGISPYVA